MQDFRREVGKLSVLYKAPLLHRSEQDLGVQCARVVAVAVAGKGRESESVYSCEGKSFT